MDISETLIPNSDQLDAEDLAASGPRTFTIERVSKGNAEQPLNVYLAEFPRPWRPGRNMRRVLAHCWGKDASQWAGKKVELYCDPDVPFGKEKVGGTRISRMSHIKGTVAAPIIVGRGKRGTYKVELLVDQANAPAKDWDAVLATALGLTDVDELKALWARELVGNAPAEVQTAITARVAEIKAADVSPEDAFAPEDGA